MTMHQHGVLCIKDDSKRSLPKHTPSVSLHGLLTAKPD